MSAKIIAEASNKNTPPPPPITTINHIKINKSSAAAAEYPQLHARK